MIKGAVRFLLALLLGVAVSADTPPPGIRGEIVDSYCLAVAGIRGAAHTACAIRCMKNGVPPVFMEAGTRRIYVLMANQDARALPPELIALAGRDITIDGDVIAKGGTNFLKVRSFRATR